MLLTPTGYIDQDPSALRLSLVNGPLDKDVFSRYADCTYQHGNLHVNATVIGASHIVSIQVGDRQLHEVLACVSLDSVPHRRLDELVGAPVQRELLDMHMFYEFVVQHIAWDGPEPPELVALVHAANNCGDKDAFGAVQEFPGIEGLATPKTVIYGCSVGDVGLVVKTAHSYPSTGSLVLSLTRLTYI